MRLARLVQEDNDATALQKKEFEQRCCKTSNIMQRQRQSEMKDWEKKSD
jgi:hypothetical protein